VKALTFILALASASVGSAQTAKPTIVLVHGAFADGSSWAKVIPILEGDGYTVIAVQNPLTSLADDVATTKRVIEAQQGPVVAVGHSYGGAVITAATAGSSKVKALVYVAAFAPDAEEVLDAPGKQFALPALSSALVPDAAGFLYIDRAKFHDAFCKDVPAADARVMAATQKPVNGSVFTASVPGGAWKTIRSWYIVASEDQAINPELERFYAKRIGATTTEIRSSHVPFLSHPREVAQVIEAAATAAARMAAFREWEQATGTRFADVHDSRQPTVVVNGIRDEMIPVSNSYRPADKLSNAVLRAYPGSGHGFLYKFHESFINQVAAFLASNSPFAPY
jgi:pimeloyl-ACP methyl ester carboxylesterase